MPDPRDFELRSAALDRVRELQRQYDDLIPLRALRTGFVAGGGRVSFGSFDPGGVVHIARRLLAEIDGPMLRAGLQGFHGAEIVQPRRRDERPDPARLELRFEHFTTAA